MLLLPHTAKGASTSSEELNAQISPRTDDEHNLPYHEDYWHEDQCTGLYREPQWWSLERCSCRMSLTAPSFWSSPSQPSFGAVPIQQAPLVLSTGNCPRVWWSLLSGLWAHPQGCFTVRFTFALLTLARVSLSVSPFFSPLSLRRGVVVVCFEVAMGELLCLLAAPCDLGDPGWGDPWFPHGAFVASLAFWYGLVIFWVLPFVFAAIPCRDDTMLSSLAWISPWTGTCHTLVLRFCFVLVFFFLLCLGGFAFGWCLFLGLVFGGDFITAFWPVTVHFWWPLNQRTALCMR